MGSPAGIVPPPSCMSPSQVAGVRPTKYVLQEELYHRLEERCFLSSPLHCNISILSFVFRLTTCRYSSVLPHRDRAHPSLVQKFDLITAIVLQPLSFVEALFSVILLRPLELRSTPHRLQTAFSTWLVLRPPPPQMVPAHPGRTSSKVRATAATRHCPELWLPWC